MSETLFITGSSGFIGSKLVKRLKESSFKQIFCLYRNSNGIDRSITKKNRIHLIHGDICDTNSYAEYLSSSDTVIHLAAVTGKSPIKDYPLVNVNGTKLLLDECKKAGVKNFLYFSTIAAKYEDKSRYYYAQSKEVGEEEVKNSGLRYTIVRPTIVIGEDSPNWKNLAELSRRSIIPIFGNGKNLIQPIYVEDVISCMVSILNENLFNGETFELGGSDVITFEDFLSAIHLSYSKTEPRFLHIPYKPMKSLLSFLERYFYSAMPFTVGQLAVFNNEGVIQSNLLHKRHVTKMRGIQDIVSSLVKDEKRKAYQKQLERECRVYTHFLINEEPSNYVVSKYLEAHRVSKIFNVSELDSFETTLLNISTRNVFFAKLVDSFASIFHKSSIIRRKIILLLAILESCSPSYLQFETPDSSNKIVLTFKLIYRGIVFALNLVVAIIFLISIRVYTYLKSKITNKMSESWKES